MLPTISEDALRDVINHVLSIFQWRRNKRVDAFENNFTSLMSDMEETHKYFISELNLMLRELHEMKMSKDRSSRNDLDAVAKELAAHAHNQLLPVEFRRQEKKSERQKNYSLAKTLVDFELYENSML